MKDTDSGIYEAVMRGDDLAAQVKSNNARKFTVAELRDFFSNTMYELANEANAYLYEQKLFGGKVRPKQWGDSELADHLWEINQKDGYPLIPPNIALSAVRMVKTDISLADTLKALITNETFEQYMSANRDVLTDTPDTSARQRLPNRRRAYVSESLR